MDLNFFVHTLNMVPLFASRPFLSAFATAAVASYGVNIPLIGGLKIVKMLNQAPDWFTHPTTLIILGALAGLEIAATKSVEARQLLLEFDSWLKAGV